MSILLCPLNKLCDIIILVHVFALNMPIKSQLLFYSRTVLNFNCEAVYYDSGVLNLRLCNIFWNPILVSFEHLKIKSIRDEVYNESTRRIEDYAFGELRVA